MILVPTLLLNWAVFSAGQVRRVYKGIEDTAGKYPYVVALVKEYRRCTGTLVTPNWVLSAAHCYSYSTHIQYGNMTVPTNESDTKRKILNMIQPPAARIMVPDMCLLYVFAVPLNEYGRLSAMDYKALSGHAVEYAGFGATHKEYTKNLKEEVGIDQVRQLQLGEGGVITCEKLEYSFAPYMCIAPKCTDREQLTLSGPGGPMFYDGKVVGVHIGGQLQSQVRYYTPVSPYLSWLHNAMTSRFNFTNNRTSRVNIKAAKHSIPYLKLHHVSLYLEGLKDRLESYREKISSALFQGVVTTVTPKISG